MFTGLFSIAGASGFNVFTVTDDSDYTDEPVDTFSTRRLTIFKTDNTTSVPEGTNTTYINFPFGSNTLTVNIPMTRDYATMLVMQWLSLDPQTGSVYTATKYALFESFNLYGEIGLIQAMTARPNIQQDANYFTNVAKVMTNISSAEIAIGYLRQISSQAATNRAAYLLANQNTFF